MTAAGSRDLWLLEAPQKRKNVCHEADTTHSELGTRRRAHSQAILSKLFEVSPFNLWLDNAYRRRLFDIVRKVAQANGQPENSLGSSLQGLYEVHDLIWHLFINSAVLRIISVPACS